MNVIELVTKYLPILDEQYKNEARSAALDTAPAFVQETADAKKVKIAKMNVDGLADYSRNNGFTTGSMDLTWEEHTFRIDRGRALQVDALDNMETFGLAFGRLAGEFQRVKVIPEIDAYRFAEYYKHAGTKVAITTTAGAIMKFIDNADAQMDDDEVPETGRILFVNPQVYKLMINDPAIEKHISVETMPGNINKKITMYDDHMIVKVPSDRFLTDIVLLNGAGTEAGGGYAPAAGASAIGMLMIHPAAVLQLAKRRIARVWAPTRAEAAGTDGVNPDCDAWKFDFRVYHDAWVLEEKIAGIYAATIAGDGIERVDIAAPEDATYKVRLEGTTALVSGVIPYEEADPSLSLDAGNRLELTFANTTVKAKADLPTGNIVKVLRANGQYAEYTKDAFEDDGTLKLAANVNDLRVGIVVVNWNNQIATTYTINTLNATLAPEA